MPLFASWTALGVAAKLQPAGAPIIQIGGVQDPPVTFAIGQDSWVQRKDALVYFARLLALHGGALLFVVGIALAAAGAPKSVAWLILIGFTAFCLAIPTAWVSAIRARGGRPWFGAGSVTEDANERLGWGAVPEACSVTGWRVEAVHTWLRVAVGATAVGAVAVPVVAALR